MNKTLTLLCAVLVGCGASPSLPDGGAGADAGVDGGVDGCRPEKSPPGLLNNPSFECGDATGATSWFVKEGEMAIVSDAHTGARAVKLTVAATGPTEATLVYELDVAKDLGAKTFCATVWAKGTSKAMEVILRKVNPNEDVSFAGVPGPSWERVPPNLVLDAAGANAQRLLLLVKTRYGKPGDVLFIDDVDIWVSPSGKCDEPR